MGTWISTAVVETKNVYGFKEGFRKLKKKEKVNEALWLTGYRVWGKGNGQGCSHDFING